MGYREAPPGRRERGIGLRPRLVALVLFIVMTAGTLPSPLYPLWGEQYGFGAPTFTLIFAVYVAGVLLGLLWLGGLSDVVGRRPVLAAGLAVCAASDLGYRLAEGLPTLLIARTLSGLATGLVVGTATAAMFELAPPSGRERAGRLAVIANTGGLGFGNILAGALAQYLGRPTHLVYEVHLAVLALTVPALVLAVGPGRRAGWATVRPGPLGVPPEIRGVFWRSAAAGASGFAVMGVITSLTGLVLIRQAGVENLLLSGLAVSVVFVTVTLGQFWGQSLAATTRLPLACAVLLVGAALIATGLALEQPAVFASAGFFGGTGVGLAIGHGVAAINADCPPHRRAEANSTFFAVMYIGLSGPVIGAGAAIGAFGLQVGGAVFSASIALVVLGVGLSVRRAPGRSKATDLGSIGS